MPIICLQTGGPNWTDPWIFINSPPDCKVGYANTFLTSATVSTVVVFPVFNLSNSAHYICSSAQNISTSNILTRDNHLNSFAINWTNSCGCGHLTMQDVSSALDNSRHYTTKVDGGLQ